MKAINKGKMFSFWIDEDLLKEVQIICKLKGITLSEVIRLAIIDLWDRNQKLLDKYEKNSD